MGFFTFLSKFNKFFNKDKRRTSSVTRKHYLLRSRRSCIAEAEGHRQGNQRRQCVQNRSASSFSDLPDDVAHHILSFLPIKDVAQVGCVSKRCRKLSLSNRSYNFIEFSSASISTCHERRRLLKCLDDILAKRYHMDGRIQSLRFQWVDHYVDGRLCCHDELNIWIRRWIRIATSCKVEVLDLNISIPAQAQYLEFPSDMVFDCASTRVLSLNRMFTIIRPPSMDCVSNLECLKLNHVKIPDEGFFKWISSSCRCIKELYLSNVHGFENFTIKSSSLKSLSIAYQNLAFFNVDISCEKLQSLYLNSGIPRLSRDNKRPLSIYAPNLKSLTWKGNAWYCKNMGEFLSLEKATVNWLGLDAPDDFEFNIDNVCKLLLSIRTVKFLDITSEMMQFLFKEGFSTLAPLVCDLRISLVSLKDDTVPAMVSLFKGMPHLSTLHIDANPSEPCSESNSAAFQMLYWRLQKLEFIHDHLKEVDIEISGGSNGITFVRYILENAQQLEKMVIHHLAKQSNAVRELTSRMVSNAEVVFKERRDSNYKFYNDDDDDNESDDDNIQESPISRTNFGPAPKPRVTPPRAPGLTPDPLHYPPSFMPSPNFMPPSIFMSRPPRFMPPQQYYPHN